MTGRCILLLGAILFHLFLRQGVIEQVTVEGVADPGDPERRTKLWAWLIDRIVGHWPAAALLAHHVAGPALHGQLLSSYASWSTY